MVKEIKGLLFDIGGVLYVGDKVIEGAAESVSLLAQKFLMRFVTNTTRRVPSTVLNKLLDFGFDVKEEQLFTALNATKDLLRERKATALPLMTDDAEVYFEAFKSDRPDYVVVGDAYTNFDYGHMNKAFRALNNGAALIAAAKNRYFKDSDGVLSLDAGGFIAALEFATGKEAQIIGKPSETFFHLAVSSMGLEPHEVLMVGDDIEADIKGAQDAGLKAVLVKTGKFQPADLERGIVPDIVLDNVTGLKDILL